MLICFVFNLVVFQEKLLFHFFLVFSRLIKHLQRFQHIFQ
ncbi:MAG: hypothetical protein EAZ97_02680 [Bacteroidetes bacterium]|nr:MAG: hypothetical protein EAZ97_02680 [Bacteroidota bacterium]